MSTSRAPLSSGEMLATAWLKNDFCRPRKLRELPKAVPLWRLRCTLTEVDRLRVLLVRYLHAGCAPTPHLAGLFCLYAAETLRRSYPGGPRTWDLVVAPLDRHMTQNDWRALTQAGMEFWRRPVRQATETRRLLHSLALEGGIPDSLVSGETKTITLFLRALLADVEEYGARNVADALRFAEQCEDRLPPAWQEHDILEMAATLAFEIARIRRSVRALPAAEVAAWFATNPNWADALPVDIGSDRILALVQGLVSLPGLRTRLPRLDRLCQRVLLWRNDEWQPGFMLESEGVFPTALLPGNLFADDNVDRVRLTLDTGPDAGKALAVIERVDGELRFRPLQDRPMQIAPDAEIRARIFCLGVERGAVVLPGGRAMPKAPWVLAATDLNETGVPTLLRFIGTGSTRTRHIRLFLAVDPETGTLGGITPTFLGRVARSRRLVHQIDARAVWQPKTGEGGLLLVPNAPKDETYPLDLVPKRPGWTVLVPYVSLGPPAQHNQSVSDGPRLHWRRHLQDPWKPMQVWPEGRITLAMLGDGFIWDMEEILILPRDAAIRTQRKGERATLVTVLGLGRDVAVEGLEVIEREAIPGGLRLTVAWSELPKPTMTLSTRIAGTPSQEIRHVISVPLAAGAFYDDADHKVAQNAVLRFAEISHYNAVSGGGGESEAQLWINIRGGLHPDDSPVADVGEVITFVEELPLYTVRRRLLRQFATYGVQDARARIQLVRNGVPGAQFDLALYQGILQVDFVRKTCVCQPAMDSVALAALSLTIPAAIPMPLERLETGDWQLPNSDADDTWLIVGIGASSGLIRPMPWGAGAPATCVGLAQCAGISDRETRLTAIRRRLDQVAANPAGLVTQVDLKYLADLRAVTRRLNIPALAMDAFREVAAHPTALLLLALQQEGSAQQDVIELEDELPFLWSLASPSILTRLLGGQFDDLKKLQLSAPLVEEIITNKLEELVTRCPQLKAACWVVRERLGVPHVAGEPSLAQLTNTTILEQMNKRLGRPVLNVAGWVIELAKVRNWMNLPGSVREFSPILAAYAVVDGRTLPRDHIRALRHCREQDPDLFDQRFREAFQLAVGRAGALPIKDATP